MSSLITDFASLSNQDTDLLTPVEYRTIVEMIRGILNSYQFKKLDGAVKQFYDHLNSRDPLYLDSGVDFYAKIVENVYVVYTKMTGSPLSLVDFKEQIAPTLAFVELFRRIVLNRYLYDQIKQVNGSVTTGTYSVYLPADWRLSESYPNPVSITIASTLADETAFIRLGWNGNTTPVATIFNADTLIYSRVDLPIIFITSADNVNTFDSTPTILPTASSDLTFHIHYAYTPTTNVTLLNLSNGKDTFKVNLGTNRKVSILLNDTSILTSSIASADGRVVLVIDRLGYLSLQVTDQMSQLRERVKFVPKSAVPFSAMTILSPYRTMFTETFGLRSVTVYQGFEFWIPPDNIVVPLGYKILLDKNGSPVTDRDGTPLMDVDIDKNAEIEGNYTYLVDRDGSLLMDKNGNYYIVPADSYYVIRDDDNARLLDDDGALIIEPLGS